MIGKKFGTDTVARHVIFINGGLLEITTHFTLAGPLNCFRNIISKHSTFNNNSNVKTITMLSL